MLSCYYVSVCVYTWLDLYQDMQCYHVIMLVCVLYLARSISGYAMLSCYYVSVCVLYLARSISGYAMLSCYHVSVCVFVPG